VASIISLAGEIFSIQHTAFWPPQSPDFSWQEKVWANMDDVVYAGGKVYKNKPELIAALHAAWAQLMHNDDYRRRLVVDCESACTEILHAQGYRVHWPKRG
jgi:hypothetical protein